MVVVIATNHIEDLQVNRWCNIILAIFLAE